METSWVLEAEIRLLFLITLFETTLRSNKHEGRLFTIWVKWTGKCRRSLRLAFGERVSVRRVFFVARCGGRGRKATVWRTYRMGLNQIN